jgi:D-alanyl-D-alanine carboxypeptidase (penicillin-binding protein 5/6)
MNNYGIYFDFFKYFIYISHMKKLLFIIHCSLFICVGNAFAFDTKARSAFLIDLQSGTEIVAKESDTLMPPSSMLKLMTLAVAFDEIKSGNLKMEDRIIVPESADYKNPIWASASKICLSASQKISVRDAVLGLIVMSGGDAGVTLAHKIAGSEAAMTTRMTALAREIGMPQSSFGNVSGLPNPGNMMTSRELATLAKYLIEQHSDLYPLFATRRFEFAEYQSEWCAEWGRNHTYNYNRLLFIMPGADGLKTGHTDDGGYGMVASANVSGRRLVGVINGFKGKNHEALAQEMKRLLNHGYTNTTNKVFYKPGDAIVEIPVWYGRQPTAVATIEKPFAITLPRDADASKIQVLARYSEPLPAPVRAGDVIGEIIAQQAGRVVARAPLVARERVGKVQFLARIIKNLQVIFRGK